MLSPAHQFALLLLTVQFDKFNEKRRSEEGASVLEWALIAAVVVAAAAGLGLIITNIVSKKGAQLEKDAG